MRNIKQHILPKQAIELSEDQFYQLFNGDIVARKDWYNFHHKKVSVGFMIEHLKNTLQLPLYFHTNGEEWNIFFSQDDVSDNSPFITGNELCDILWDLTKETAREVDWQ